jgi:hypothetical protein
MELLTPELTSTLPKRYSQEANENPIVYIKFFFPIGNWTWFVTEGEQEGDDFIFFGFAIGHEEEWGYFSLSELSSINVRGLTVERDLYFDPAPIKEILRQFRAERE